MNEKTITRNQLLTQHIREVLTQLFSLGTTTEEVLIFLKENNFTGITAENLPEGFFALIVKGLELNTALTLQQESKPPFSKATIKSSHRLISHISFKSHAAVYEKEKIDIEVPLEFLSPSHLQFLMEGSQEKEIPLLDGGSFIGQALTPL